MERMNQPPFTAVVSKKSAAEEPSDATATEEVKVSQSRRIVMARVSFIKPVRIPANYSATVTVQVSQVKGTVLLKPIKSLNQTPNS